MSAPMVPAHVAIESVNLARQAGVKRGINASIQALEELQNRNDGTTMADFLPEIIAVLQNLTVEQVEG